MFETNPNTEALITHLLEVNPGETVKYEDMTRWIGQNIRAPECRGWLQSARRRLEREKNVTFLTIRGVGIMRGTSKDILSAAPNRVQRIRREAYRQEVTLACCEYDDLNQDDKSLYRATTAQVHFLKRAASAPAKKKLLKAVRQTDAPRLGVQAVLDALKDTKPE